MRLGKGKKWGWGKVCAGWGRSRRHLISGPPQPPWPGQQHRDIRSSPRPPLLPTHPQTSPEQAAQAQGVLDADADVEEEGAEEDDGDAGAPDVDLALLLHEGTPWSPSSALQAWGGGVAVAVAEGGGVGGQVHIPGVHGVACGGSEVGWWLRGEKVYRTSTGWRWRGGVDANEGHQLQVDTQKTLDKWRPSLADRSCSSPPALPRPPTHPCNPRRSSDRPSP